MYPYPPVVGLFDRCCSAESVVPATCSDWVVKEVRLKILVNSIRKLNFALSVMRKTRPTAKFSVGRRCCRNRCSTCLCRCAWSRIGPRLRIQHECRVRIETMAVQVLRKQRFTGHTILNRRLERNILH